MTDLTKLVSAQVRMGYWPGFIVGMYPSNFAYDEIKVDFEEAWHDVEETNLYFHIPFCKMKCSFCTFPAVVQKNGQYERYVDKLIEHLEMNLACFDKPVRIKSICFGGGTPNILPIEQIERIMNAVQKSNKVILDEDLEPSMEASPEIVDQEYLSQLPKLGIQRISMGVQSLDEHLRNKMNRKEGIDLRTIVGWLREAGLNINMDVINGLENQTEELFMGSLAEIITHKPETISIYPLSGPGNSMFRKKEGQMTPRDKYAIFDTFHDFLTNNGYDCESHVKFIRSDTKSTHQQKIYEYQGTATMGIGYAARSYTPRIHYRTDASYKMRVAIPGIDTYIEKPFNEQPWVGYRMNEEENKRRHIIYGFFLGYVDGKSYKERFGSTLLEDYPEEFTALSNNEMLDISNPDLLVSTYKGRKFTDLMGCLFWSPDIQGMYNGQTPQ